MTLYSTIVKLASGAFAAGPAENCADCGAAANVGKLVAVATDFADMKNGHKLLCQACKAIWQTTRDQVADDERSAALVAAFFAPRLTGLISEHDESPKYIGQKARTDLAIIRHAMPPAKSETADTVSPMGLKPAVTAALAAFDDPMPR